MNGFKRINDNTVYFIVDIAIYNDTVISKVLYWLIDAFYIERESLENNRQQIVLEKKKGIISEDESYHLKEKLNQDFIDFKLRDIVNAETQNIRDILYIKAFANNDDFEDYNLIQE